MLLTAEARARHVPQVGFFRASADSQFSTSRRTCGFAVAAAVKPQETRSDCELRLNKQLLEKARSFCMMRSCLPCQLSTYDCTFGPIHFLISSCTVALCISEVPHIHSASSVVCARATTDALLVQCRSMLKRWSANMLVWLRE